MTDKDAYTLLGWPYDGQGNDGYDLGLPIDAKLRIAIPKALAADLNQIR